MRIAKNSNFCLTSNHRVAPTDLTKRNLSDSVTSFTVTSNGRSSILFGHRIDHHVPQVLQVGDPFAVLIVVQNEWVSFLLKSISNVDHAVFSFLGLLGRN